MKPTKSTLTYTPGHKFQPGDVFSINQPDRRWWKNLWCRILGKPAPTRRVYYKCTDVNSSTSVNIVPH